MATFHIPITCSNISGSTNFKIKYRLQGDSIWTSYLISPSGSTTVTVPTDSPTHVLLDNRIYDFQVQNINGADNPLSVISQSIGITEPDLSISPTSAAVGYSFPNLSQDIDSYTVQITTVDNPGSIIAAHVLSAGSYPNTVSDTFTGLDQLTAYRLLVSPVANQFTSTFIYYFSTTDGTSCPDVIEVGVVFS